MQCLGTGVEAVDALHPLAGLSDEPAGRPGSDPLCLCLRSVCRPDVTPCLINWLAGSTRVTHALIKGQTQVSAFVVLHATLMSSSGPTHPRPRRSSARTGTASLHVAHVPCVLSDSQVRASTHTQRLQMGGKGLGCATHPPPPSQVLPIYAYVAGGLIVHIMYNLYKLH